MPLAVIIIVSVLHYKVYIDPWCCYNYIGACSAQEGDRIGHGAETKGAGGGEDKVSDSTVRTIHTCVHVQGMCLYWRMVCTRNVFVRRLVCTGNVFILENGVYKECVCTGG